MSDDKYIQEIDTIVEEDLIPNPPQVNGKLKYYLIVFIILLAIISALAVVFSEDTSNVDDETNANDTANVQYII